MWCELLEDKREDSVVDTEREQFDLVKAIEVWCQAAVEVVEEKERKKGEGGCG